MIINRQSGKYNEQLKSKGYEKPFSIDRRIIISNIDVTIIRNKKISSFLSKLEDIMGNILSSLLFLENYENFTKDKKDLTK